MVPWSDTFPPLVSGIDGYDDGGDDNGIGNDVGEDGNDGVIIILMFVIMME